MPTYAYACTACDHRFEIFQSFSEDSLSQCPQCDGRLRKLFNAVGVVFKGGGFYRHRGEGSGNKDGLPGGASAEHGSGKGGARFGAEHGKGNKDGHPGGTSTAHGKGAGQGRGGGKRGSGSGDKDGKPGIAAAPSAQR